MDVFADCAIPPPSSSQLPPWNHRHPDTPLPRLSQCRAESIRGHQNKNHHPGPPSQQQQQQQHYRYSIQGFSACTITGDQTATSVRIRGATACYDWKREDRHMVSFPQGREYEDTKMFDPAATTGSRTKDTEPLEADTTASSTTKNHGHPSSFLLAFAGVFDGHGGPGAAEYCAHGLLSHIQEELKTKPHCDACHSMKQNNKRKRRTYSTLMEAMLPKRSTGDSQDCRTHPDEPKDCTASSTREAAYIRAFHNAQQGFGLQSQPQPTQTRPVLSRSSSSSSSSSKSWSSRSFLQRSWLRSLLLGSIPSSETPVNRRHFVDGGTTACTLSLFCETPPSTRNSPTKVANVYAVVANCGDSRLICDDGQGGSVFRQVTRDHRPLDVLESRRLQDFIQLQGPADPCHVAVRQRRTTSGSSSTTTTAARSNSHTARIYPGGLAVSRSIGDLNYCKAVIPTPDVVQWKLKDHDAPRTKDVATTHRFLVATDGLWDVLSNETVGRLAARLDDGHEIAPKVAATRVMEHCLERGGSLDDVTILIMDITFPS